MKFTAIIIDDEKSGRVALREMLKFVQHEVEVVAEADSYETACSVLLRQEADLVFMDISMGSYTAFDVLDSLLPEKRPRPVFVTAHEEFALQSYKYCAIDYLMKPVGISDLQALFRKLEMDQRNSSVPELPKNQQKSKDMLIISDRSAWHFLNINDVVLFKGSGSYTQIFMEDGNEYTVSKAIGYYEEFLVANSKFLKVHRSFIINISKIASFEKSERVLLLKNGMNIPTTIKPEVLFDLCFG